MNPVITNFPVDNGDMTLFQLELGRSILIDINIRAGDGVPDVLKALRARLMKDDDGRHYIDAMLLTHPDQDHCRGFLDHFHVGPLSEYVKPADGADGKIVVREMWSSPMIFRRQSSQHDLCPDAAAWCSEARRRANLWKSKLSAELGDRIQVMGEDETNPKTGKSRTDGLEAILVKAGSTISKIDGQYVATFSGFLIAPKGQGTAAEEERRSKNHSSVIANFSIANGAKADAAKYLAGGDALVGIWERVWTDHKTEKHVLEYDILGTPHHCSWHSLSTESWKNTKGRAVASEDAKSALGQARDGAYIVASSKEVRDDYDDPPCIGAKRQYENILSGAGGAFLNTAVHVFDGEAAPMEFEVLATGPVLQAPGSRLGVDLVDNAATDPLAKALKKATEKAPVVLAKPTRFA